MGLTVRSFIVNDDGSIRRLPLTRYEKLIRRDPNETFPEYAGKRVKYAEVAIELEDRKPVDILRTMYFVLTFDSEGRLDAETLEKGMKLGVEMLPAFGKRPQKVVDATHRFAKKSFDEKYRWEPTQAIEQAIMKAIFGEG